MTEDLTRNDTEGADGQLADGGSGGESQGFTGAEGFEQLAEGSEQLVGRPAPGDSVEISAEPGQTYVLDFDPSQARALVEGDNLILVFEDGGQIVFENLVNLAQLEDGPSIQYADMDIIALLQAQGIIPGVFDSFELIQPEPGQIILIQSELGQRFVINFDPAIAQVTVDGDNLIMTFSDGGQIVIAGLGSLTDQSDAPLFSIAGAEITSGTLMGTAAAISGGESGPDATATLETAAGGEEPVGTGATQYSDDTGDIIDTIGAQGVIPPTALEFDVPDPEPTDPIILPNPPVAFGSSVSAGEGELIGIPGAADTVGGFVYKFDVGEENDISDNIHGTDEEDGVTTAFTITSLPEFGVLVVDSGDDGTLDAVYGVSNAFIAAAAPLPPGGIEISSGDAVYYFLPIEQVFANEADGGLGGDATSSTDTIVGSISVQFDYFTTDSSGLNSAESTLGVTFDAMPVVSATDGEVDEAALSDGSNPGSPNETDTGTFTINTFGDTLATVTVGGVDVTGGGVVNGTYGDLTVTETAGAYSWSYTLSDNTTDHPTNPSAGTSEGIADEFSVTVTDSDGDVSAEDTLTVAILDDGPDAHDDGVIAVAEDTAAVIDVQTNDEPGADGVDFTDGTKVFLADDGSIGSAVYNDDGTFTYTPNPGATGADSFTYTITDGDGDTDTARVSVNIAPDSTPTVSVTDGEVDEAALSDGSNPGSPNETDTGTFTINTFGDTLAILTVGGFDVTGGGVVNGTYGDLTVTETAGAYSWSYTLSDNTTDHPTNPSAGTSEGIADEFSVTVTDSDGDVSVEDTLTVAILDDGPSAVTADQALVANSGDAVGTGDLNFLGNVGADQPGDIQFDSALTGTLLMSSGGGAVTAGMEDVFLKVSGDGHTLTAVADVDGDFATTGDQTDAFTIALDPSGDSYTIDFDAILDDGAAIVFDNFGDVSAGGPQEWIALDDPRTVGNGDLNQDVLFTSGPVADKVNTSSQGIGVGNQQVDVGEVVRIDFVSNINPLILNDATAGAAGDLADLTYDAHYTVNNTGFGISQDFGLTTVNVSVYDADDDSIFDGDLGDVQDTIISVTVIDDLGAVIISSAAVDTTVGDVGVDFLGDGTVTVSGLLEGYQTLLSTADGFNRIEVESIDSKFDLGGIVVSTAGAGEPIDMDFTLVVSDEDGDTAAGTLAVTTVPDGGSVIVGTGADETLIGGTTDDTLTGNGGSDNLTGGAGVDTFIFAAGDGGATVALADLISDFEDGTDLIGLTGGLTFGDLTIDQSSDVVGDGTNDTVISVTAGGEILAILDGITTTIDGSDIAIV